MLFTAVVATLLILNTSTMSTTVEMKTAQLARATDPARLPVSLLPIKYKLKMVPHLEPEFKTYGEVWITMLCVVETDVIVLNINDIDINADKIWVEDMNTSTRIPVMSTEHDQEQQFFTVRLNQTMEYERHYQIYIPYISYLNDLLQGFYRSSYIDTVTNETRWLATTQFSPTDARRAFPCFDEPLFKASFQISICRQTQSMDSLSNMPLARSYTDEDPEWTWDEYPETLQMSTYLVAFIVSDFRGRDVTLNTTTDIFQFRVWSRKEVLQHTQFAGYIGPRMLEYLEHYFGIAFPLPKQDMIAIPDFGFRAMENWGLITFRESAMLYEAGVTTEFYKESSADVIGHELAHQWFGNLVTPLWWNDLWLKEGFATFIGNMAVDNVQPEWSKKDVFIVDNQQSVFSLDALESSHPISVPVAHPDEIRQIFDRISYDKGASIIAMMSNFLGEETFKAGLTGYLTTFMFSNAEQKDLWDALDKQAHLDNALPAQVTVGMIMDTWTLQTGYPVVHVNRDYDHFTAQITQERFLLSGRGNTSTGDVTWWVPLTYTSAVNPDFEETRPKLWLENSPKVTVANLPDKTKWILVNVRETAYYRVNYDTGNWQLLMQGFPQLPDLVQAQLLDDALNLAAGGYLDYSTALQLTSCLKDSVHYLAWRSTIKNLAYVENMLALTPVYDNLKEFMLDIMSKLYGELGFEDRPTDSHSDVMNRVYVLKQACHLGHKQCVADAKKAFNQWMTNSNFISPNQRSVVYCTGISEGGEDEWEFAWEKYQSATLGAAEREEILDALGCSKDPVILERYLGMVLSNSSGIRKQDGGRAFAAVAGNVVGHTMAFDFLRQNWMELQSYYGLAFSVVSKMVQSLGTFMNTPQQLMELHKFREDISDQLGTAERSLNQTIEKVEINVFWMENSYEQVEEWLLNWGSEDYKGTLD